MRSIVEEVKKMGKCDCCEKELTRRKPEETHSNLYVYMGVYSVKIDIVKSGMVTDLCADCLQQIIEDAMSLDDPFYGLVLFGDDKATEARKRKQRKSCPAYLLR